MEDMAEFKWSIVVVLLILAWFFFSTWKMINTIHITKLKLLYDVELTKWIGGYYKAKHLNKKKRINSKAEHELFCFIACH